MIILDKKNIKIINILAVTLTLIIFATCVNTKNQGLNKIYPEADDFKKAVINSETVYFAYKNNEKIGVIINAYAQGYGGIIHLKVGIGVSGLSKNRIHSFTVTKHSETPVYFRKLKDACFMNIFLGKTIHNMPQDEFDFKDKLGVDTVSGATKSCLGILNALKNALNKVKSLKL